MKKSFTTSYRAFTGFKGSDLAASNDMTATFERTEDTQQPLTLSTQHEQRRIYP